MDNIIGACGITCSGCDAYIATKADDLEAKKRVVAAWSQEYKVDIKSVDDITCDGCMENARVCYHAPLCEIRSCAIEKGVKNCAYCDDYACDKLSAFLDHVTGARETLDAVRRSL